MNRSSNASTASLAFALMLIAGSASSSFGLATLRDGTTHSHDGAWWESELACQHAGGPVWWVGDTTGLKRKAFDDATGKNLLNYPPHRFVDFLHMKLAITIFDMNVKMWQANQTLTIKPIATSAASLVLNVAPPGKMEIYGARMSGDTVTTITFSHQGEELTLTFNPPLAAEKIAEFQIDYILTDPVEGITWTPESPAWPGRPAQLHSQGQPESNHYWFPCHDFPNERLTTEIIATVPEGFLVCSNGRLVESKASVISEIDLLRNSSSSSARTSAQPDSHARSHPVHTFHWLQDKPHVNYLVTFVVGKFDVVDVGSSKLPMPVYAPLGKGSSVDRTYGRTPKMIKLFERLVDEPYPWDKYAQLMVWNFGSGGMENTSATTMYDTAILDETALLDGDLDGLISHELAHQWFGDLLTCKSWEHIWLNEGFATYFTHLWFEERDGKDAYLSGVLGSYRGLAANDKADAPFQPPMCSKEYSHPWEVFSRASNPYPKGASILHMLREKLGDKVFFDGLKLYVDRMKFGSPETSDLRYAFEDVSGLSLDRFFRQWCFHPGVPHVDVSYSWDSASSSLQVSLTQTQQIDGANPAFFFSLPIWIKLPNGQTQTLDMPIDGKEATQSFPLAAEPTLIAVDPDLSILAEWNVQESVSKWRDLLTQGPTIASKFRAVAAIQKLGWRNVPSDAVMALNSLAKESKDHFSLRIAAVEALGEVGTPDLILAIVNAPPSDARIRKAVVEQIAGTYEKIRTSGDNTPARLMDNLRRFAKSDRSYGVRSAALRALGKIGGGDAKPIIVDALKVESQNDQVRQAALEALASLDDKDGLGLAIRATDASAFARTRPTAINAVGTLAHHDPELAFNILKNLLDDPAARTAKAAGDALVKLGDARALAIFQNKAATAPTPVIRDQYTKWASDLQTKLNTK